MSQYTDTSKNTKTWAVSQYTDTSKNTKTWAVSQHIDTRKNSQATLKQPDYIKTVMSCTIRYVETVFMQL